MNPILHRSLRQMLMLMIHPSTLMLLLHTRRARLESCEIDRISVHQLFGNGYDVRDEAIQKVERHAFADDDTEDLCSLAGRGERVVCSSELVGQTMTVFPLGWQEGEKGGNIVREGDLLGIIYCFARSKVLILSCFTWP